MKELFLPLLDMSITASFLVAAVVVLRLVLKKAPKNLTIWLWIPVAVRLLCPISVESIFSLLPKTDFVPVYQETTAVSIPPAVTGIPEVIVSPTSAPPTDMLTVVSVVWIVGVISMLAYTFLTYAVLKYRIREAIPLQGRIWLSDRAATPYILGVVAPKIYLPSSMSSADHSYVIAHERSHLKRGDHIVKPLAFILLSVYWFNPLMWVAYILLCRDIELACDERVIRDYKSKKKVKAYMSVLLRCSAPKRSIAACPVAFGETAVSSRVRAILSYKKPTFWITLITVLVGVVLVVCFLTDPESGQAATHDVTNSTTQTATQTTVSPTEVSTTVTTSSVTTSSATTTESVTTTTASSTTMLTTAPTTAATTTPTTVYTPPPTTTPTTIFVFPSYDFTQPELVKPPTLPSSYNWNPKSDSSEFGVPIFAEDIVPKVPYPKVPSPNVPIPRSGYNY